MTTARWPTLLVALLAAGVASACGQLRLRAPERPGQTLIVLLPDDVGDSTGRATVSNPKGATNLESPNAATIASTNRKPTPAKHLSDAEVQRIFGDALSALPPAPQRFTLYFRFESDELTADSRSMVPDILESIKNHPVPELLVIGHTDTTGARAANFDLGRKRAEMVRGPGKAEHRGGVAEGKGRDDAPGGGGAEAPFDGDERDHRRHRHEGGEQEHARGADREKPGRGDHRLPIIPFSGYSPGMQQAKLSLSLSLALLALGLLLRLAR